MWKNYLTLEEGEMAEMALCCVATRYCTRNGNQDSTDKWTQQIMLQIQ